MGRLTALTPFEAETHTRQQTSKQMASSRLPKTRWGTQGLVRPARETYLL
jgi:hypothetical protein